MNRDIRFAPVLGAEAEAGDSAVCAENLIVPATESIDNFALIANADVAVEHLNQRYSWIRSPRRRSLNAVVYEPSPHFATPACG